MLLSFFSKKVQDSMYSSNRFKFGVKGKLKKNVPDPQLWHVSMTETFLHFFPFFFIYTLGAEVINVINTLMASAEMKE